MALKLSRRAFAAALGLTALPRSVRARPLRGSTPSRLLFVLYGQSNMAGFSDPALANSVGVPAALPGTAFYDGSSITTVPAANGVRECLNAILLGSGTRCLALNGSVAGSNITGLSKGSAPYIALMAQVNAVIQPYDRVFILWDQGEAEADGAPHPDENAIKALISQLHGDMATDMGRTKATCPFIMSGLGTTSATDGALDNGTTDGAWQTMKNAIYNCSLEQPFNHFSHSNIDLVRTDIYHYDGVNQGKQGKRFAQTVKSILGVSVGEAHFQISSAATVDATHINVDVVHSAGTDFSPASGGNGWETTNNNGANWNAATSVRVNATRAQLTCSTLSGTSADKLRYGWGMLPPNASGVNPPTAPMLDNSVSAAPLTPTTWDIQPTPLSVRPVPTPRYAIVLTGAGQVQTAVGLPLGPPPPGGGQRFLIFSTTGIAGLNGAITVTPDVGSVVTAAAPVKRQGNVQVHQVTLGADANAATKVNFSIDYGSPPFGGGMVQMYTVPLSDLLSTTPTGSNGASIVGNVAITATVNVAAGGFIIQATKASAQYSTAAVLSGDNAYAKRFENGAPFHGYFADASNCSASAVSSATGTFPISENIDMVLVSWR